ncbi:MAG: sporulation protein YunB [Clostridiales bacterium]|nr:sporulation protein YunB [Clostridiales bacterium]
MRNLGKYRKSRSRRTMRWKTGIAVLFCVAFMLILNEHVRPIMESITTNQARVMSINIINSVVAEELKKNEVSYSDLISVERSDSGEVLAITTNMVKMNELKAVIIQDVQDRMDSHTDVGIPIGTFTGNDFLHGRGPEVPLRLTLSGNVNAEFKSSFQSAGINQTKHQIYLNIHTSVYSLIPGFATTTEVDTNLPVAETVIVGQVPQVVANLK